MRGDTSLTDIMKAALGIKAQPMVDLDMSTKIAEVGLGGLFPPSAWPPHNAVDCIAFVPTSIACMSSQHVCFRLYSFNICVVPSHYEVQ